MKGAAAREFFEANFVPVRIRKLGEAAGFLTGYYEPIVDGSRFPTREFSVPIYRRPPDLTAPGLADGAPFPNTGKAFRRTASGELVPYYDRGAIEDGALDGQHLEICWVRSQTDALFIGIEGSAQIRLEDGTMMHINYDAHNGYPYVPVGRVLIERGLVPREEMSMQRIREWMHDNPEGAKDVRRQNRSMVFFRIVGLDSGAEALGAQGIPLSAGRSIAVDKNLHVYGTPFFIEADLPLSGARNTSPFRRTMIAQDTGSAIVGPARADLFFGAGDEAGQMAGRIKQAGRFTMLLPRELDPTAAGAHMPLPPVKLAARGGTGKALPEAGKALPEAATKALPGSTDEAASRSGDPLAPRDGDSPDAPRAQLDRGRAGGTRTAARAAVLLAVSEKRHTGEMPREMIRGRRPLTEDEERLWAAVARSVRPLRAKPTIKPAIKPSAAPPAKAVASKPQERQSRTSPSRTPPSRASPSTPSTRRNRSRTRRSRRLPRARWRGASASSSPAARPRSADASISTA